MAPPWRPEEKQHVPRRRPREKSLSGSEWATSCGSRLGRDDEQLAVMCRTRGASHRRTDRGGLCRGAGEGCRDIPPPPSPVTAGTRVATHRIWPPADVRAQTGTSRDRPWPRRDCPLRRPRRVPHTARRGRVSAKSLWKSDSSNGKRRPGRMGSLSSFVIGADFSRREFSHLSADGSPQPDRSSLTQVIAPYIGSGRLIDLRGFEGALTAPNSDDSDASGAISKHYQRADAAQREKRHTQWR